MKTIINILKKMTIAGVSALAIILVLSVLGVFEQDATAIEVKYTTITIDGYSSPSMPVISKEDQMKALHEEAVATAAKMITPPDVKEATDRELIAQTVWGEARGCTDDQKELVVWCIVNRYDDGRFGKTISEIVKAPNQFLGYSSQNPIEDDILRIVDEVLYDWKMGQRGLPIEYIYFYGDGFENHFYTEKGEYYN